MGLIVQKFGGTSVGSIECIQNVAKRVARARADNHDVVVVVSAMNGETDRLVQLARAISKEPDPREYDALVSTGECVTTSLLSMALKQVECEARSYTGAQAGIKTNGVNQRARIENIHTDAIRKDLENNIVPVVAGFQGVDERGNVTTLGRGGSDTTAVALAVALGADECQIYTDVDGVYTTDPRVVPEARCLHRITFEEMLELASLGAKVLQIRSVEFAGKYNVPLRVRSSFNDKPGTLISYEDKRMEQPLVSGIAFDRNQAKVSVLGVPDRPGIAQHIFGKISQANIDVDVIVQNVPREDQSIDISFTIQRDDYKKTMSLLETTAEELKASGVQGNDKVAKLSIVGVGMRSHPGVAATMFKALAEEGVNLHLISTSEIKVSVVIDERHVELGTRTLHRAFDLAKK